ncbi:hypothetical protein [Actinoallomurus iriomotensis]|uniref:EspG family protein n=1 Tax=Actinoallomurus iriomotensis TaxID=478107 RepID=A0A9W6S6Z9_9ACTN|nr:hypothetical protein [Actinoallomurus iriomotensis]GLY86590.1 hypothetical protein Airi02_045190 [Actinoallomurus iriomotensis]
MRVTGDGLPGAGRGEEVMRVTGDGLPGALSSDELCAAAWLAGRAPLPAFASGWASEEHGVAAAVAVRGLLARGLAEPGPRLAPAVRGALEPLLHPDRMVEVRRDEGPAGRRRHVFGESGDRRLLAAESVPSIWELVPIEEPIGAAALAVAEPLVPRTDSTRTGERLVASARLLARVDALLAQGAGLGDEGTGGALTTVLSEARVLVTVRTTGPAAHTAAAITWLDAGPAGLWLITPEERGNADDVTDPAYALTATGHETVRDALADLLRSPVPKEEEPCPTS